MEIVLENGMFASIMVVCVKSTAVLYVSASEKENVPIEPMTASSTASIGSLSRLTRPRCNATLLTAPIIDSRFAIMCHFRRRANLLLSGDQLGKPHCLPHR
ncbi:MAG TPA: hypothetical protein VMI73_07890 [Trebonia sp.]|nr:hypothetical protein [Trebonia sp.]